MKESDWISVGDKLPNDGDLVIATDARCDAYCSCKYSGRVPDTFESLETGEDFDNGDFVVTHWMPIVPPVV